MASDREFLCQESQRLRKESQRLCEHSRLLIQRSHALREAAIEGLLSLESLLARAKRECEMQNPNRGRAVGK
jgi:hypothetical protein